jgi:hypothetical protein
MYLTGGTKRDGRRRELVEKSVLVECDDLMELLEEREFRFIAKTILVELDIIVIRSDDLWTTYGATKVGSPEGHVVRDEGASTSKPSSDSEGDIRGWAMRDRLTPLLEPSWPVLCPHVRLVREISCVLRESGGKVTQRQREGEGGRREGDGG